MDESGATHISGTHPERHCLELVGIELPCLTWHCVTLLGVAGHCFALRNSAWQCFALLGIACH
eukprot:3020898-Pyramimonas_sp.AAC.1